MNIGKNLSYNNKVLIISDGHKECSESLLKFAAPKTDMSQYVKCLCYAAACRDPAMVGITSSLGHKCRWEISARVG